LFLLLRFIILAFSCSNVLALEFTPGVGVGVTHTDNATLTPDKVEDTILSTIVSAKAVSDEGALKYNAITSLSNHNYTQDTFDNQRYFKLQLGADWEMVKERFNWFLTDNFNQRTVRSINTATPNNIQDSNTFTLGANLVMPVSARQSFSITPAFSQYYLEIQPTNSNQYSVALNWNYLLSRVNNIGLSLTTRNVEYFEQVIADVRFTTLSFVFSGSNVASSYTLTAGSTNVKRETGEATSGFSGSFDWLGELTSRSKFSVRVLTDLTDSSAAGLNSAGGDEIQVTTDVIRNKLFQFSYIRDDSTLHSSVNGEYREVTYSESPLDRIIRTISGQISYPATPLLSLGSYIRYNRTEQLVTSREDRRLSVGGNLTYRFSRDLKGLLDVNFHKKTSDAGQQEFEEIAVFAGITYGFGAQPRPLNSF